MSKPLEELTDAIAGHWVSAGDMGFELDAEDAEIIAGYLLIKGYRKVAKDMRP